MARRRTRLPSELWIEMPREYSDHPICKQLMTLKDEAALQDVAIVFGSSGSEQRMSGFLLSLLSPVWRARLCGEFRQGRDRRLDLEEAEAEAVNVVIELGCGRGGRAMKGGLAELIDVGGVAERYQVDEVRMAVEDEVMRHLTLQTCGGLLMACEGSGLRGVEEPCRRMALERFEELTTTEGFMRIGKEVLRSLLEDDRLECGSEEKVFEGVVRWMKGADGSEQLRGEGLLETIRFPQMSGYYLMTSARNALERSKRLERLVVEASGLKSVPSAEWEKNAKYLSRLALRVRWGGGGRGDQSGAGRGDARRLGTLSSELYCLADGGESVYGGLHDGVITVWNKATLAVERTLTDGAETVFALAVWEGWLVSASRGRALRVWDVGGGGGCVRRLEGHLNSVLSLAVSGGMMLSGSCDDTIRVWRLEGPPSAWACERTLAGRPGAVHALAWWGDRAVGGCSEGAISVWDVSTGGCVRTLEGHTASVEALVVKGCRLMSSSADKCVREWCLDTGACVRVVQACPSESAQYIQCLAISGRKLVGGSVSGHYDASGECEVVVWDVDTWAEERRVKQPAGQRVLWLLAMGGEVWGGVGRQAAVWGREG